MQGGRTGPYSVTAARAAVSVTAPLVCSAASRRGVNWWRSTSIRRHRLASAAGHHQKCSSGEQNTGRPSQGGSIATASGLVFIGAADDNRFRAFDAKTGKELWTTKLNASAESVPATYQGVDGKQYVVVAGTGGGDAGAPVTSDEITAFRLP